MQHADDLAATLDALDVERVYVVGHSMGAFVSVRFAERHPDRIAGLALIDGGLPVPSPEGIAPEDLPKVLLGPALERLSMTFPSRADYVEFWQRHPALGPYWNSAIEAYVQYDLDGDEPALRSSASADAVAVNAVELDGSAGYTEALLATPGPVDFFRAPAGPARRGAAVLRRARGRVGGAHAAARRPRRRRRQPLHDRHVGPRSG